MTRPEIPRAVLEALAEAAHEYSMQNQLQPHDGGLRLLHAIDAYRAAKRPLRTRADVDAEIVVLLRGFMDGSVNREGDYWASRAHLFRLCSEPTRDELVQDCGCIRGIKKCRLHSWGA